MTKKKIETKDTDNTANLGIGIVMPRCDKCVHWKREFHAGIDLKVGECFELPNDKIDIEIKAGWNGGIVEKIETDEDWFCASFNGA